jgi:hypothetical protein
MNKTTKPLVRKTQFGEFDPARNGDILYVEYRIRVSELKEIIERNKRKF